MSKAEKKQASEVSYKIIKSPIITEKATLGGERQKYNKHKA